MGDDASGWIVIPNWPRFQHYADRTPIWTKEYVSQLDDADYGDLALADRGLVHGLRLLFASSAGQVRASASELSGRLRADVTVEALERLNHAGFVELVVARPPTLAWSSIDRDGASGSASPRALARGEKNKRREDARARASASEPEPSMVANPDDAAALARGFELHPVGVEVDAESLRLAKSWMADGRPEPEPDDEHELLDDLAPANPFLDE